MSLISLGRTACACALAAVSLCLPAQAAPIIASGSSYDMLLFGENLPPVDITGIRFDGLAQTIVVTLGANTRTLNIIESDTDLGDGRHHIVVELTSDGDLFPGRSMLAGVGGLDPFDLLSPLRMDRSVITITDTDGTVRSGDFAVYTPEPWDGSAPRPGWWGAAFGGTPLEADTRSVRFDLYVTEIPEPTSLVLVGAAGAALLLRRRRKTRPTPSPSTPIHQQP